MPHRRRETLQAVRDALARVQRISHVRARGANPYPEEGGVMLRLATNLKPTPPYGAEHVQCRASRRKMVVAK